MHADANTMRRGGTGFFGLGICISIPAVSIAFSQSVALYAGRRFSSGGVHFFGARVEVVSEHGSAFDPEIQMQG